MFDRLFNVTLASVALFLVYNLYLYCREHCVAWNVYYTLESLYWAVNRIM